MNVGFVRKPITCPACDVVTAVPVAGQMWLTRDAAGFYPHGYRCREHKRTDRPDVDPQPYGAPPRLPEQRKPEPSVETVTEALKAASALGELAQSMGMTRVGAR